MCRRVTCKVCNKPTWAGCGQHVEMALAGVPKRDRCAGQHTDAERRAASGPSLFGRFLGRS